MPDNFVIKPFLEAHRAEVKGMLLAEYSEEEKLALVRDSALEEGREEGMEKGMLKILASLVKEGILSVKEAANRCGVTEAEFRKKMRAE